MIDRKHYAILAFPTTQAAAAAEAAISEARYAFRLIPMPEEVSAGCGLVLQVAAEEVKEVGELLTGNQVLFEGCYEIWFENRQKMVKRIG